MATARVINHQDGEQPFGLYLEVMRWQVNELIPAILETQTPIVAAVRGSAIGLGLNLTLAADFAVVAVEPREQPICPKEDHRPHGGEHDDGSGHGRHGVRPLIARSVLEV